MTLFGLHSKTVPCVLTLKCHHCEDFSNPFVLITLPVRCYKSLGTDTTNTSDSEFTAHFVIQ